MQTTILNPCARVCIDGLHDEYAVVACTGGKPAFVPCSVREPCDMRPDQLHNAMLLALHASAEGAHSTCNKRDNSLLCCSWQSALSKRESRGDSTAAAYAPQHETRPGPPIHRPVCPAPGMRSCCWFARSVEARDCIRDMFCVRLWVFMLTQWVHSNAALGLHYRSEASLLWEQLCCGA